MMHSGEMTEKQKAERRKKYYEYVAKREAFERKQSREYQNKLSRWRKRNKVARKSRRANRK